ncbi:DNA adenine methylase [Muricauda sp. SCSIO 64092]|uniref:DNA adenine methylase n=1 Tax=Allomuricauda sp. SCSIO 64092 TaxID=2908842 RepID=UPI001FF63425|nr:DNA adenine methylase [Muricauda sp. SCSIO 64092]UOY05004.1 DNA adenine methylase [Muricauda sp. SCSIO 64092]
MPKTPISYYGGKINMLKEILPRIPKHRIYTEAFFGGGAVFFAKEPSEAEIINDINGMVVNFFEVVKTDFNWLKNQIEATLFARETYSKAWLIYKTPSLVEDKRLRAWACYVACNMGFANKPGSWGYDKYNKRVKTFRNKTMRFDESIVKRLEFVQIENNDACKVIESRDTKETFHYVDPPYINTYQGDYCGYTECDYRNLLDTLSNIKGTFLLSSYPSEILDEYVAKNGWYSIRFEKSLSARKVEAGASRTHKKVEVLTANYPLDKDD